jgi:hypothetical protein
MGFMERAIDVLVTPSHTRTDWCIVAAVFTTAAIIGRLLGLSPTHYIFVPVFAAAIGLIVTNEINTRRR